MNRNEALRLLGLDEDASPDDIKAAYRETAQIMHPDRFASNKKLQARATEQFKNLQEAYEYLKKNPASKGSRPGRGRAGGGSDFSAESAEARLAGIAAARVQLTRQKDVVLDERRNAIAMAVVGGLVALFTGRRPFGLFGVVAAVASAAAVWGVVQVVSSQRSIKTLDEHISELRREERRIARGMEEE